MRALIMAGGAGTRLGLGEKPLISLCNRPMISYVIDAFCACGCEVVVAVSPRTPMTRNWCRANGIDHFCAAGANFILDMEEAVSGLDETRPLFVSVSDIPCINAELLFRIQKEYLQSGMDACSVWVPVDLVQFYRGGVTYRQTIHDTDACPAGVNILRGDRIGEQQEELQLVIPDLRLAINVNTPADHDAAGRFLEQHSG
ncbi:MAG: NTP transferase domain-containing protein [Methanoregula sp.]|jgi:adenosylcobinamide-phosphate guanylyltransferase